MQKREIETGQLTRVKNRYVARFALGESEIRAAQRLRHQVFAEEFGARLHSSEAGLDSDDFDPYCLHLIVRDEDAGCIVGTYRLLPPQTARLIGRNYSEGEFDMARLVNLRSRTLEVGRSCVAADHRSGSVIALLWMKLAEYMVRNGYEYLMGCASISMADGGHNAANIYNSLPQASRAPLEYRVFPHTPLPVEHLASQQPVEMPPLIRGYLRAGAWVCGEPAWDPDFNSADLFLLLPMANLSERYKKHFVRE